MDRNKATDWIQTVSRGSLSHPNDKLWEVALKLECEFHKMHGNSLSKEKKIFKKLAARTMSEIKTTSVPNEVVMYFARTRTYIRLRDLNRKISFTNAQRNLDKRCLNLPSLRNIVLLFALGFVLIYLEFFFHLFCNNVVRFSCFDILKCLKIIDLKNLLFIVRSSSSVT